jgi:hypothetical protein
MHKAMFDLGTKWGDIEQAAIETSNNSCPTIDLDNEFHKNIQEDATDRYDIMADLKHYKTPKTTYNSRSSSHSEIAHPFLLSNDEYFKLRRQLNREQQTILKDVLMSKKLTPDKPLYLFLTGGAGTGKTFTAKVLFEALIRIYDKKLDSDPLKTKGVIVASTGKAAFNAGGITAHSIFHLPCNSAKMLPLDSNTLDNLSKRLEQLQILLIDEASLIGSRMLYNIDRRLRQIKHTPTKPFGNIDIIFCGDLYQAQPICDTWIFEQPTINSEKLPYTFWLDNVLSFKLNTVIRQRDEQFISILNRARTSQQTDHDLAYMNNTCHKTPPNDPRLPYLFQRNLVVDEHNKKMLDYFPTQLYIFEAIDSKDMPTDPNHFQVERSSLPSIIYVKPGILIELIAGNLDVHDGLVNGADGIFQLHLPESPNIAWIQFNDPTIGKLQRQKMQCLYTNSISPAWTPILKMAKKIRTSTSIVT